MNTKSRSSTINCEDLTGRVFHMLKVAGIYSVGSGGGVVWACDCTCGNRKNIRTPYLISGSSKSCGCHKRKTNLIEAFEGHAEIVINSIKFGEIRAIIDLEDVAKCKNHTWCTSSCTEDKYGFYIRSRNTEMKSPYLHRLVMGSSSSHVDHINHNKLDNRKCNLRLVTAGENAQNKVGCQSNNKTSGIKNIHYDKSRQKWGVSISLEGNKVFFKRYDTLEEAKLASIEARKKFHPFFSQEFLNEPEN